MMKNAFPLLISVLLCTSSAFSQTQDVYNSVFIWGINKNTSSGLIGGFVLKKSKRWKGNVFRTYGLELVNITHAQETRLRSIASNNFIYGKSNYLYALRLQYGYDIILFKKSNQQGVEIKGVVAAGPSIGIVAPYYIERLSSGGPPIGSIRFPGTIREQYDPNNPRHSYNKIIGPGYFLQGIGESKIQIGGNIKIGAGFELGTGKSNVAGFEIGFLLDAYLSRAILIPTAENNSVFPTLYFTLFYGHQK